MTKVDYTVVDGVFFLGELVARVVESAVRAMNIVMISTLPSAGHW